MVKIPIINIHSTMDET